MICRQTSCILDTQISNHQSSITTELQTTPPHYYTIVAIEWFPLQQLLIGDTKSVVVKSSIVGIANPLTATAPHSLQLGTVKSVPLHQDVLLRSAKTMGYLHSTKWRFCVFPWRLLCKCDGLRHIPRFTVRIYWQDSITTHTNKVLEWMIWLSDTQQLNFSASTNETRTDAVNEVRACKTSEERTVMCHANISIMREARACQTWLVPYSHRPREW